MFLLLQLQPCFPKEYIACFLRETHWEEEFYHQEFMILLYKLQTENILRSALYVVWRNIHYLCKKMIEELIETERYGNDFFLKETSPCIELGAACTHMIAHSTH